MGPAYLTPEQAPREPARWPWVLAVVVGSVLLIAALVGVALVSTGDVPRSGATTYLWMAGVGAGILLIGLVGLAVRAIRVKRFLPPERYRGPSIFVLLLIVLVAGNVASGAFLLDDLGGLASGRRLSSLSGTILLLLTPIAFIGAAYLFVLAPRALVGFRLDDGRRTLPRIIAGVMAGAGAWVVVALLSLAVEALARATGMQVEGQQMVADLLANVPPPVALVAAAVIVPFGEELFFRGVVMNAWTRDFGPRRALWGSALLFTAIHVPDGGILIVPPILVLALLLGFAYQRTRSLPLVVALHGTFNAVSTVLLVLGAMSSQ